MLYLHRPFFASSMLLVLLCFLWAAPDSHAQVYRCGNSYSTTPCAGGQEVEIKPAVQAPTVTAQITSNQQRTNRQERKEERDWERTERELDKAEAAEKPMRQQGKNSAACAAASRRIQKIDELARKGGSAQKMEKLREDRQATRDKQFRMGC